VSWLLGIPVVGPFLTFAWTCLQIAGRICHAIPGAIWAVVLVVALWWGWNAADARNDAVAEMGELQAALANQKIEAGKLLAHETAEVLRLEHELGAARAAQETTDATNRKTLADLRADMRRNSRAAGGEGLRDPWATGCRRSGDRPEGADSPAAEPGGGDGTDAGRVLSAELEGLLLDRLEKADTINIAYASCRADTLNLRKLLAPE